MIIKGNNGISIAEKHKLPDDLFYQVKEIINNKKIPHNNFLIGHHEESYNLKDNISVLQKYLCEIVLNSQFCKKIYEDYSERLAQDSKNYVYCDELWVNWMKKMEYNPPHTHFGIFSFVIFVKIPFQFIDEDKIKLSKDAKKQLNGRFCFIYNDGQKICTLNLDVDKTYEGQMFIFPSTQMHQVYPFFSSNDYRITVSGNLFVREKLK